MKSEEERVLMTEFPLPGRLRNFARTSIEARKRLFATHYHELNEMSDLLPRIHNYNVSVKELKDTVLFIRKLVKGGSAHSFGIHVAKMAGMPQTVIRESAETTKKIRERPFWRSIKRN